MKLDILPPAFGRLTAHVTATRYLHGTDLEEVAADTESTRACEASGGGLKLLPPAETTSSPDCSEAAGDAAAARPSMREWRSSDPAICTARELQLRQLQEEQQEAPAHRGVRCGT